LVDVDRSFVIENVESALYWSSLASTEIR